MSIENFVANLEKRRSELKREYSGAVGSGRRGAITREIKYIDEKLMMATRKGIQ